MNLYSKLLQVLNAHGVQRIFGIPGDAINPMLEALRRQADIEYIHVTHEESGALAASAAAKLSGQLQVCAGTVGPGAIHLLNGLYDAKKDRAPVLAIVGQVHSEFLGSDYHQEVNLPALFSDVADYITEIRNPSQMPAAAIEACNTAVADNSVAVLIVPNDIGEQTVPDLPVSAISAGEVGRFNAPPEALAAAAQTIDGANEISLFVGEGARNARDKLLQLAEHLHAPIIFSLKAKDIVPYDHPLTAGGLGLLGGRAGVKAMGRCDLLLVIGSDFPYRDWFNQDCAVIQIDNRARVIGRRRPGTIGLHSDVTTALDWLLEQTRSRDAGGHPEKIKHIKNKWDEQLDRQEDIDRSTDIIYPQTVARLLGELADDDAIFTCDTGEVTVWGARHLHLKPQQRFTLSFNLASMAYAMPAAIGAQLHFPRRQVISMSGDGGFNMLMGDFLTAVKYKLPIKVVVFNNGKLGLIKLEQEGEGYPEHETGLLNPDYSALASAMGGTGYRVDFPHELQNVMEEAFATQGPAIIDVAVSADEVILPPKISASQVLGYGMAKIREFI